MGPGQRFFFNVAGNEGVQETGAAASFYPPLSYYGHVSRLFIIFFALETLTLWDGALFRSSFFTAQNLCWELQEFFFLKTPLHSFNPPCSPPIIHFNETFRSKIFVE